MDKLSFKELAIKVLTATNEAMTTRQMWDFAAAQGWDRQLDTFDKESQTFTGKTPWESLGSTVYTDKKIFECVSDTKPKKFRLRTTTDGQTVLDEQASSETQALPKLICPQKTQHPKPPQTKPKKQKSSFNERDLHPVLCTFLRQSSYFNAYAKTIFHENSTKGSKGADRWLHPDVVAVSFEYAGYKGDNVFSFIEKFDKLPIKIFSFELKKELNFGNYKESFFQAVSNSSWANEGYLVAHKIHQDKGFIESLQKLSQSFGIGIVQLNLEDIGQSQILSPAKFKEKMNYSGVDELATKNKDFRAFLKTVTDFDVSSPERFVREFDRIPKSDDE